jgi:hypothetical protein
LWLLPVQQPTRFTPRETAAVSRDHQQQAPETLKSLCENLEDFKDPKRGSERPEKFRYLLPRCADGTNVFNLFEIVSRSFKVAVLNGRCEELL